MYKSEQTLFFSGLKILKHQEQCNRLRPWGDHMKHRHGTFFLAVVLSTAAPIFADEIPANFTQGDKGSVSMPGWLDKDALKDSFASCNLGLSTFKEDEFRIESNPAVLVSDFGKDGKISLDVPLNSGLGPNDRPASLFDLSSNRDSDGPLSVVATPEPGSFTLLLFGLAALEIIGYRRYCRFRRS
jgi:PEP-CTERM motif-containing protein